MTPTERLRLKTLRELAQLARPQDLPQGTVRSQRRAAEIVVSLDHAFGLWASVGYCEWRLNAKSPRSALAIAHSAALRAAELVQPYRAMDGVVCSFSFPAAAYLSYLLSNSFSAEILALLPPASAWRVDGPLPLYLDSAHLIALSGGAYPDEWDKCCTNLASYTECGLIVQTHQLYQKVIASAQQGRLLTQELTELADLYNQRGADEYFSNDLPRIEGGGGHNEFCIDFRLAVIIEKYYRTQKPKLSKRVRLHSWSD